MSIGNEQPGYGPAQWPSRQAGRSAQRAPLVLALVLAANLCNVAPCRATGLVIEAPTVIAAPGTSGSFDILLVDTDPAGTAGYNVAGDSLQLVLSGSAVQFTNATINTVSAPYIFTQSVDGNYGFPLFTNTLPATVLMTSDAGDIVAGYPGYTTVNPGETFGLANVSFTVSPTFTSRESITFVLTNGATSLSDPNGVAIPFTVLNGLISPTTVIPEPSSLTQGTFAALSGLGLAVASRVRNRSRSPR
jgi:hypothetical protein